MKAVGLRHDNISMHIWVAGGNKAFGLLSALPLCGGPYEYNAFFIRPTTRKILNCMQLFKVAPASPKLRKQVFCRVRTNDERFFSGTHAPFKALIREDT